MEHFSHKPSLMEGPGLGYSGKLLRGKTFADSHKIAKFAKVFSLESFPLYGMSKELNSIMYNTPTEQRCICLYLIMTKGVSTAMDMVCAHLPTYLVTAHFSLQLPTRLISDSQNIVNSHVGIVILVSFPVHCPPEGGVWE